MEPLCMYIDGLLDLQQYFDRAEAFTSASHIGLKTAIGTSMLCRRQETQTEVYTCISPSGDYTQNMNVNFDLIERKINVERFNCQLCNVLIAMGFAGG